MPKAIPTNRLTKAVWYDNEGVRAEISGGTVLFAIELMFISLSTKQQAIAIRSLNRWHKKRLAVDDAVNTATVIE